MLPRTKLASLGPRAGGAACGLVAPATCPQGLCWLTPTSRHCKKGRQIQAESAAMLLSRSPCRTYCHVGVHAAEVWPDAASVTPLRSHQPIHEEHGFCGRSGKQTIMLRHTRTLLSTAFPIWHLGSQCCSGAVCAVSGMPRAYATEIKVPSMGDSITDGVIGSVFKAAGDSCEEDEPILQIETDKVPLLRLTTCAARLGALAWLGLRINLTSTSNQR
jgi:Biotin-requiring enzyme